MEGLFCEDALYSAVHEISPKMGFTTYEAVAFAVLSPISVLVGCSTIILYLWHSALLKQPGDLILCQIVCQFVTDLTWLYSGVMYLSQQYIQDGSMCGFMSLVSSYSIFAACGYNLALSIEVFQKLNKPFNTAYSARFLGYHLLTHSAAMAVCLANAATNTYGLTPNNSCFFSPSSGSKASLIPLVVIFGYELTSFALVFYIFMRLYYAKRQIERNILFRHSLFAFVSFCLFVVFPGHLSMDILEFFTDKGNYKLTTRDTYTNIASSWEEAACIVSCLSGSLLCSVRLLDYLFSRRENRLILQLQSGSQASGSRDQDPGCFPGLIEEVLFESLVATLLSLHLMYQLKEEFKGRICPYLVSNMQKGEFRVKQLWELDRSLFDRLPSDDIKEIMKWYKVGLFEYAPAVFRKVCATQNISQSDLAASFNPQPNLGTMRKHAGNKGGRSDAFIYFTYDRKFIIKTLSAREMETLRRTLRDVTEYYGRREGQYSLLAKFFGVFTLYFQGRSAIHIAIMENIIPPTMPIVALFDLKGSRVNRQSLSSPVRGLSQVNSKEVLKDLDFKQILGSVPLSTEYYRYLHAQLRNDTEELRRLNLMDYSLLVAVCKSGAREVGDSRFVHREILARDGELVCYVGVIDYLQKYTLRKKVETSKNAVVAPRTPSDFHSCVHPLLYSRRFCNFLLEIFPNCP